MPYKETNQKELLARYSLSNWAAEAGELSRIQGQAGLEIKTLFQNKTNKKTITIPLVNLQTQQIPSHAGRVWVMMEETVNMCLFQRHL